METGKDKTIEELVKELEYSINKKLEDWKSLKEDLEGRKLTNCEQHMKKISIDEAEKLLPIMKKLEERFGYGRMFSQPGITGGSEVQLERILKFSKTEGNTCEMLDALADAGYTLNEYEDSKIIIKYITEKDVTLFKRLMKDNTYKEFHGILKTLKTALGYDNKTCPPSHHAEIENLIELTKIRGEVIGAICLLADKGYRIKKETGLTENHVEAIEYITRNILKETETSHLYKRLKPELFKGYFANIGLEKKKKIMGDILESEYSNEEIIKWLDDTYPDLIREISFKD